MSAYGALLTRCQQDDRGGTPNIAARSCNTSSGVGSLCARPRYRLAAAGGIDLVPTSGIGPGANRGRGECSRSTDGEAGHSNLVVGEVAGLRPEMVDLTSVQIRSVLYPASHDQPASCPGIARCEQASASRETGKRLGHQPVCAFSRARTASRVEESDPCASIQAAWGRSKRLDGLHQRAGVVWPDKLVVDLMLEPIWGARPCGQTISERVGIEVQH